MLDTNITLPTGLPPEALGARHFNIGEQHIVQGNCCNVLPLLADQSIEVVMTSPPYNQGVRYRTYHDTLEDADYLAQMNGVLEELRRALKPGGSVFLNLPGSARNPQLMTRLQLIAMDHFVLQNQFVWAKSIAIGQRTHGNFRPINSPRFVNRTHEIVLQLTHSGSVPLQREAIGVPYTDASNVRRWQVGKRNLHCAGSIWHIPYENRGRGTRIGHPAPYPLDLVRRCLKLHGRRGLVLDPYLGSGTTLCVAAELGWPAIGIEIDPTYAAQALDRLTETILLRSATLGPEVAT